MDTDLLYQRLGEFVVAFQWLENRLREIGWIILDPHRKEWPPKQLRNLRNEELIIKVESLYVGLLNRLNVKDSDELKDDFKSLMSDCHAMRKYRNNLLHSAFIELKSGDDVLGILRSNPKLKIDPDTGDPLFDQEMLTEAGINAHMTKLAQLVLSLNNHYTQLSHWAI